MRGSKHLWQAGKTFASLGLSSEVASRLESKPDQVSRDVPAIQRRGLGLETPTLVQRAAVPAGRQQRDVLVRAETGSGKTLAFLLPVVDWLVRRAAAAHRLGETFTRTGTRCIILAPTRELVTQIEDVASKLCQPFPWLVVGSVTGGERRKSEKARLRRGVTILVATPGRLVDHLTKTKSLAFGGLTRLKWLVLDEADRLLDMGFTQQLTAVMDAIREAKRQAAIRRAQQLQGKPVTGEAKAKSTLLTGIGHHNHDEDDDDEDDDDHDVDDDDDEEPERVAPATGHQGKPVDGVEGDEGGVRNWTVSLFSATLSPAVRKLAGLALNEPVFVDGDAGSVTDTRTGETVMLDGKTHSKTSGSATGMEAVAAASASSSEFRMPRQLSQLAVPSPIKWRLVTILGAIRHFVSQGGGQGKVIVFLSTCDSVDFHHALLSKIWSGLAPVSDAAAADAAAAVMSKPSPFASAGAAADAGATASATPLGSVLERLHGNLKQVDRAQALKRFRAAKAGVLIATDVAARGLDLPSVDAIVQADVPESVEEYAHRAGRTARSGQAGRAVLLLAPHEMPLLRVLASHGLNAELQSNTPLLDALRPARLPLEAAGITASEEAAAVMKADGTAADERDELEGGSKSETSKPRPQHHRGGMSGQDRAARMALLLKPVASMHRDRSKRAAASAAVGGSADGAASSSSSHRPASSSWSMSEDASKSMELHAVRWQVLCEEIVSGPKSSAALRLMAVKAFTAHVRAYACFSKELKVFLHPRALHLGHLAKAYGLLETPSKLDLKTAEEDAERETARETGQWVHLGAGRGRGRGRGRGGGGGGGRGGGAFRGEGFGGGRADTRGFDRARLGAGRGSGGRSRMRQDMKKLTSSEFDA